MTSGISKYHWWLDISIHIRFATDDATAATNAATAATISIHIRFATDDPLLKLPFSFDSISIHIRFATDDSKK